VAAAATASLLSLAASLTGAAVTLETGANKPCSDVHVKYLPKSQINHTILVNISNK